MKTRNAIVMFAVAAAFSVGLAAPASAVPSGSGCPKGFQILHEDVIVEDYAAPGFEDAIRSEDVNNDDHLCFKLLPPAVDFYDPTFFYQDNDFPVRR